MVGRLSLMNVICGIVHCFGSPVVVLEKLLQGSQHFRGTQRENLSAKLEISFSTLLDCFRAF